MSISKEKIQKNSPGDQATGRFNITTAFVLVDRFRKRRDVLREIVRTLTYIAFGFPFVSKNKNKLTSLLHHCHCHLINASSSISPFGENHTGRFGGKALTHPRPWRKVHYIVMLELSHIVDHSPMLKDVGMLA